MKVEYLLRNSGYEEFKFVERLIPYDHPKILWFRLFESSEIINGLCDEIIDEISDLIIQSTEGALLHNSKSTAESLIDYLIAAEVKATLIEEKRNFEEDEAVQYCSLVLLEELLPSILFLTATQTLKICNDDKEHLHNDISRRLLHDVFEDIIEDFAIHISERIVNAAVVQNLVIEMVISIVECIKIAPKLLSHLPSVDAEVICKGVKNRADEANWVDDESTVDATVIHQADYDDDVGPGVEVNLPEINENEGGRVVIPPLESCSNGYYVSFSTDGREINEIFGKVVAADFQKQLIAIQFNHQSASAPHKWIPYKHPFLIWYRSNKAITASTLVDSNSVIYKSVVKTPSNINNAIGYLVHIRIPSEDGGKDGYFCGSVVAVDEKNQLLSVAFDLVGDNEKISIGDDIEKFLWTSPNILWMGLPRPHTLSGRILIFFALFLIDKCCSILFKKRLDIEWISNAKKVLLTMKTHTAVWLSRQILSRCPYASLLMR